MLQHLARVDLKAVENHHQMWERSSFYKIAILRKGSILSEHFAETQWIAEEELEVLMSVLSTFYCNCSISKFIFLVQRTFVGVDAFTVFQEILLRGAGDPRVSNIVRFSEKIGELKVEVNQNLFRQPT